MILLGVDPSSSAGGLALLDDQTPLMHRTWKPPGRLKTFGDKLAHYSDWFESELMQAPRHPELAVVEFCTNVAYASMHTIRVLGHYEAASYLVLQRAGIPIRYDVTATMARAHVFGGHIKDKERAVEYTRALYPDLELTEHECDATVLALAHDCKESQPKARKKGAAAKRRRRKSPS
jgi:Holliday junction resolvasome RuvABC endonuclease subunit